MQLRPNPGFDPSLINWGGPDEPRSEQCSYCDAPLPDPESPDYEIPLMMWNQDGWCAVFCAACMTRWWGVAPPMAPMGPRPEAAGGPGYWMAETTGVLRPAVEAYLNRAPLTEEQIATLRAYLRQWIMAPTWDANPHAGAPEKAVLAGLRAGIAGLTSREAISRWLSDAVGAGLDPL